MTGMGPPANDSEPLARQPACPICGKPRDPDHRPFCSKRCADVDLQRWFSGRYAVPASDDSEEADDEAGGDDRSA